MTTALKGMARISTPVLQNHALTCMDPATLACFSQVNKRCREVAKPVLAKPYANFQAPIDPESPKCTELLTQFYKHNLARMQNPRAALTDLREVSFQKNIFLLHRSNTPALRYISPDELSNFRVTLASEGNLSAKLNIVHDLMKKALALPPHLYIHDKLKYLPLHNVDFDFCLRGRTILSENELYKVERTGVWKKDLSALLILQLFPIINPSEQEKATAVRGYALIEEIYKAYGFVWPRLRCIEGMNSAEAPIGSTLVEDVGRTSLETAVKKAALCYRYAELGRKVTIITTPSDLYITFDS